MSQAITKINKRIRSVTGAYKVTSAMKLVSTVKLKSYKNKMLTNRDFNNELEEISEEVFRYIKKVDSPLLKENDSNKKLYIVITSSLGLCGSYNINMYKAIEQMISQNDDVIFLGSKGASHYEGKYNAIDGFENYSSIKDEDAIKKLEDFVLSSFIKKEYREIHLLYSHYKNSLVFTPMDMKVLPLKKNDDIDEVGYGPLIEPNPSELFNDLASLYIKSSIYSKLLESEVCEHAARSNAMENATDNAKSLLDELHIEYNKARQGAITQEITEIVGAAEAL